MGRAGGGAASAGAAGAEEAEAHPAFSFAGSGSFFPFFFLPRPIAPTLVGWPQPGRPRGPAPPQPTPNVANLIAFSMINTARKRAPALVLWYVSACTLRPLGHSQAARAKQPAALKRRVRARSRAAPLRSPFAQSET